MKYEGTRPGRTPAAYVDFSFKALEEKLRDPQAQFDDPLDIQALLQSYKGLANTALALAQAMNLPKDAANRLATINELWDDLMKRARMAQSPSDGSAKVRLTDRQREVLALMVQGKSNAEICSALQISDGTCKTHVSDIIKAFGVRTRAEVAAAAR